RKLSRTRIWRHNQAWTRRVFYLWWRIANERNRASNVIYQLFHGRLTGAIGWALASTQCQSHSTQSGKLKKHAQTLLNAHRNPFGHRRKPTLPTDALLQSRKNCDLFQVDLPDECTKCNSPGSIHQPRDASSRSAAASRAETSG